MFRRFRIHLVPAWLALLAVVALPAFGGPSEVTKETSLRPGPGAGQIAAFLTAGTEVEVLERQGDWVRVRVDGWVPAHAVAETEVAPAASPPAATVPATQPSPPPSALVPAPAAPPPAARPQAPAATGVAVEGTIRIKLGRWKKRGAAGAPVMLLPAGIDLDAGSVPDPEMQGILADLEAEVGRLEQEAKKAMSGDNFTDSTLRKDELMRERAGVLGEIQDLLAASHGRHEQAARAAALVSTLADAKGWFNLAPVVPGSYTLYARMVADNVDLEWIEQVDVAGTPVRIDLDAANGHGVSPR